jgi:hypothetical protein
VTAIPALVSQLFGQKATPNAPQTIAKYLPTANFFKAQAIYQSF